MCYEDICVHFIFLTCNEVEGYSLAFTRSILGFKKTIDFPGAISAVKIARTPMS